MNYYSRIVIDIETGVVDLRESVPYFGPFAQMKGGASKTEQTAADSQRTQETQLMQQQLQMQQQQISGVNSVLDPLIQAGGMSQDQQSALTSLAMNNIPATFGNAEGQINQNLVARGITGGSNAGSGDISRNFGQLEAMKGALQQQSLSQIQLQKQSQLMQALSAKMGVAGLYGQNTGLFNQGASSALNSGVSAANNVDQAQASTFGSIMGGLGVAAGGWASGGFKH